MYIYIYNKQKLERYDANCFEHERVFQRISLDNHSNNNNNNRFSLHNTELLFNIGNNNNNDKIIYKF